MLTVKELEQVRNSLRECAPDVEVFNWGPTLQFAQDRKKEALKILNRAIREAMQGK